MDSDVGCTSTRAQSISPDSSLNTESIQTPWWQCTRPCPSKGNFQHPAFSNWYPVRRVHQITCCCRFQTPKIPGREWLAVRRCGGEGRVSSSTLSFPSFPLSYHRTLREEHLHWIDNAAGSLVNFPSFVLPSPTASSPACSCTQCDVDHKRCQDGANQAWKRLPGRPHVKLCPRRLRPATHAQSVHKSTLGNFSSSGACSGKKDERRLREELDRDSRLPPAGSLQTEG